LSIISRMSVRITKVRWHFLLIRIRNSSFFLSQKPGIAVSVIHVNSCTTAGLVSLHFALAHHLILI
jgi:hypothetical protein